METNSQPGLGVTTHNSRPIEHFDSKSASSDEELAQAPTQPVRRLYPIPVAVMAAQHKFIPPPCFSAKVGENAVDWLERYELTARYNHWGNQEMRNNFVMYLEGTARKWYLFSNLPGNWEDQEAVPAAAGVAAVPFMAWLRTVFLQEFKQDYFALIQEAKLRQRVQGEEEDAASYYYDILHICHAVNPNMPQTQQLDFLYIGLHKSLVNKMYPLKPKTCKEFLELLKLHTEASLLLDRRSWTEKTVWSLLHQTFKR